MSSNHSPPHIHRKVHASSHPQQTKHPPTSTSDHSESPSTRFDSRRHSRSPGRERWQHSVDGQVPTVKYFEERRLKRNALKYDCELVWSNDSEVVQLMAMEKKGRRDTKERIKSERSKKRKEKRSKSNVSDVDSEPTSDSFVRSVEPQESVKEDDHEFGPTSLMQKEITEKGYGKALLPGEGTAIASFVQAGQRIPRRGEVGLTSDSIKKFEDLGFVMSGSRNHRMNAIRIRKENQVIAAEEKRATALLQMEEKAKKEQKLIANLRKILDEKK